VARWASIDFQGAVSEARLDWNAEIAELNEASAFDVALAVAFWFVRICCAEAVDFCANACAVLVGS
jgi:hypothetical protein